MSTSLEAMNPADRTLASALRMAKAFVDDELRRRRGQGDQAAIVEAATVAQHIADALRWAGEGREGEGAA